MDKTEIILQNDKLKVDIAMPGHVYSGSRFDWTGFITRIVLNNKHTFCTHESLKPGMGSGGIGLCNEFGIDEPIGYEEANINEQFPKIGVGLLTKDNEESYHFFKPYKIKPYPVEIETGEDYAKFVVLPVEDRGYAFELIKKIHIRDNFIDVEYNLTNCGKKSIRTSEYIHNFISIDNCPVSSMYNLTLPCVIQPLMTPDCLIVKGNNVTWNSTPSNDFYMRVPAFDTQGGYSWELSVAVKGAGIREYDDFQVHHLALWGCAHVISPEVFYEISLKPNETKVWKRAYELFEIL